MRNIPIRAVQDIQSDPFLYLTECLEGVRLRDNLTDLLAPGTFPHLAQRIANIESLGSQAAFALCSKKPELCPPFADLTLVYAVICGFAYDNL